MVHCLLLVCLGDDLTGTAQGTSLPWCGASAMRRTRPPESCRSSRRQRCLSPGDRLAMFSMPSCAWDPCPSNLSLAQLEQGLKQHHPNFRIHASREHASRECGGMVPDFARPAGKRQLDRGLRTERREVAAPGVSLGRAPHQVRHQLPTRPRQHLGEAGGAVCAPAATPRGGHRLQALRVHRSG